MDAGVLKIIKKMNYLPAKVGVKKRIAGRALASLYK